MKAVVATMNKETHFQIVGRMMKNVTKTIFALTSTNQVLEGYVQAGPKLVMQHLAQVQVGAPFMLRMLTLFLIARQL